MVRPEAIIKSPEELDEKIGQYVNNCEEHKRKATMAGLALFLGYGNVCSIQDLQKRPERPDDYKLAIGRFKLYLEDDRHNRLLTSGQPTVGLIFDLKNNFGWTDRQEVTGADGAALAINYVTNIKRDEEDED